MFAVKETGSFGDVSGGRSNSYSVVTTCKTVGQLIGEIERANARAGFEKYGWGIYERKKPGHPRRDDYSLRIGSYWTGSSRDHSKYDDREIIATWGDGGWFCPIMIAIVIEGENK